MGKRSSAEVEVGADVQVAPAFACDVSVDRLRAVAEFALHYEQRAGQVTLVITDDLALQQLNRDFLGIDAPTDVLAFSSQEEGGPFVVAPEAGDYLGDVIVSYPRSVAQAAEVGHPVEQELNLLVVHGLLHLLGYDHADEAGKAIMWTRQEAILRGL
ncbi:rRNA maturation RNase YbeY [Chloroflexota bacterium]